ncbi:MAG: phosphodiester glycosidase family protein [Gammaproteobacteria bacterium]
MRLTPHALLVAFLLLAASPAAWPLAMFSIEHEGVDYDVVRLDKGEEQRLGLYWKRADGTPYATIHALREDLGKAGKTLLFATNGGIYSKSFTPLGLYIENGRRYYRLNRSEGGGNFFLRPNGVFYITAGGAAVVDTRDYAPKRKVLHAIQSGPLLVRNGRLHPRFFESSSSLYVRNGVGVDREGRVVFAISDMPVNFHDFATLFRDRLDAPNALYLDGSISAMYAPGVNRYGGWGIHNYTSIIGLTAEEPAQQ